MKDYFVLFPERFNESWLMNLSGTPSQDSCRKIQTFYRSLPRPAVSSAENEIDAIDNVIFRGSAGGDVVRRSLVKMLSPSGNSICFTVPCYDGPNKRDFEDIDLAHQLATIRRGKPEDYINEARKLMDFYRKDRGVRQQ